MSVFYCPNCNKLDDNFDGRNHKTLWANCRDGYGRGIYHIACPNCGYKLSGYMQFNREDANYVQSIISMYSDRNFINVDKILETL
jgi:predicted RNA-binding Zn-ribbon protein involved in translation (DUF1610 family)